jgi:hypothetical protein
MLHLYLSLGFYYNLKLAKNMSVAKKIMVSLLRGEQKNDENTGARR